MDFKFSTGVWVFGPGVERFCPTGYRKDIPIPDRIRKAAKVKGLTGLEFHYPTEISFKNVDEIKSALKETGLKPVIVFPHIFHEPKWKRGALASLNEERRKEAVKIVKETKDITEELGAELIGIWPGRDGFDYPFQVDYVKMNDNFVKSLKEIAEYKPHIKVALEYKLEDPQSYIIMGSAGKTLALIHEVGSQNIGINLEVAHALIARENVAETVAYLLSRGKLFHMHLNDTFRHFDNDLIFGSVNFLELMEMVFWLVELGYDHWLGVDVFPTVENPVDVVAESIENVKLAYKLLEKIGFKELRELLQEGEPIPVQRFIKKKLFPDLLEEL